MIYLKLSGLMAHLSFEAIAQRQEPSWRARGVWPCWVALDEGVGCGLNLKLPRSLGRCWCGPGRIEDIQAGSVGRSPCLCCDGLRLHSVQAFIKALNTWKMRSLGMHEALRELGVAWNACLQLWPALVLSCPSCCSWPGCMSGSSAAEAEGYNSQSLVFRPKPPSVASVPSVCHVSNARLIPYQSWLLSVLCKPQPSIH